MATETELFEKVGSAGIESVFLCEISSLHNLTIREIEETYGVVVSLSGPKNGHPYWPAKEYTAVIEVIRGEGFIDLLRKAAKDPFAYDDAAAKIYGLLRDTWRKKEYIAGHWETTEDIHEAINQVDQSTRLGSLQKALEKYLYDTGLP